MARRSKTADPEEVRGELIRRLVEFEPILRAGAVREQVKALVPVAHALRDLGGSLMASSKKASGRARILEYLRAHVGEVIEGGELMVVAGIDDYARRIRELRKEDGWPILSGVTARQMVQSQEEEDVTDALKQMRVDDYMLLEDRRDEDAARRWKIANTIRNSKSGVQSKVLAYLQANVGIHVTGEELRYVAKAKNEWPRRTRELRTEQGWPVVTRFSGDPSLPVGIYVLAENKQSPVHDRNINELTRRAVLQRDHWACQWEGCGWSHERLAFDKRFLELHHIREHAEGGSNEADNLVTLCNLHHDEVHRSGELHLNDQAATLL